MLLVANYGGIIDPKGGFFVQIFGKTDVGLVRETNQDTFMSGDLTPSVGFALVCDGMGGENGGNVASQLARDIISTQVMQNLREYMDPRSVYHLILAALNAANSVVYEKAQQQPALTGMGTTAVLAVVMNDILYIGHVGDSRAYLLRKGKLTQLTKDHSFIQYLLEHGQITEEQAKSHPQKNQITRAIGVESTVEIDYNEFPCKYGDKILLCTDGLTNCCSEAEILLILEQNNARQSVKRLLQAAKKHGGHDNITAVVLEC